MTDKRVTLDPFYPVMPDFSWVARVVANGARLVQLRMKTQAGEQRRAEARQARDLCASVGATLVLNDHWELALAERIDFVHLGQGDLDDADLPALRRAGIRLGISTHDAAELDRALALAPDYIALGPIYPTTLKAMPWAPQGLARIGEWKARLGSIPLVAIGGIDLSRAGPVLAAGADSVAAVTDLVTAAQPDLRTAEWLAATRPRA